MRGNMYQQKLADKVHVSRETISKYENGRSKIPKDVSRILNKAFDNPKFAITLQQEYTGTGPVWLDGPNVDLHRSAVKEKTDEEVSEFLEKLRKADFSKPFRAMAPYERQDTEDLLSEAVEAITSMVHFVAVTCMEGDFSYVNVWGDHYTSLKANGFLAMGGTR
ncbi:helix-turn-helix domain-containing protein [Rummeliibacillus sp. POC4]|nr:helix-turn-helix domain-containing protein [Rummeliibacillus sp. POC4]